MVRAYCVVVVDDLNPLSLSRNHSGTDGYIEFPFRRWFDPNIVTLKFN